MPDVSARRDHNGGPLIVDRRQGMELVNRGPLEFEDELVILRHVAAHPQVDADRLGHVGVSHAGEMLFKLASQYPGAVRAGVACEPANHEFLSLAIDEPAFVDPSTGLRNIEEMQMRDPALCLRCVIGPGSACIGFLRVRTACPPSGGRRGIIAI